MRESTKQLLIYAAIGIIAAGITAYFLYQNRMEFWKVQACSTLRVALAKELHQRSGTEVYFSRNGNISLPTDSSDLKKEPIKVWLKSELGERDFFIPYEKHIHNIESSSDIQGMHSYLLHIQPLVADSLNRIWENLLTEMEFPGRTIVHISVADWWEHETYTYSDDSLYVAKSDSLISYYLGNRCEVGVTGYLYYPWWMVFTIKVKVLLCILVICCFLLFFIQEYIARVYRRFFVKKIPVIIEKEVPVFVAEKSQAHIYQLEKDLHFDADSKKMYWVNTDGFVKLTSLPAKLLQGFLEAENYRLTINEIMELLWPDGSGTPERVHTTIKRLRDCLSEISDWRIVNENLGYLLKSPHSIEEIE